MVSCSIYWFNLQQKPLFNEVVHAFLPAVSIENLDLPLSTRQINAHRLFPWCDSRKWKKICIFFCLVFSKSMWKREMGVVFSAVAAKLLFRDRTARFAFKFQFLYIQREHATSRQIPVYQNFTTKRTYKVGWAYHDPSPQYGSKRSNASRYNEILNFSLVALLYWLFEISDKFY